MMRKSTVLLLLFALAAQVVFAQNSVQRYIEDRMLTAPELKNVIVAIYAEDEKGRAVAELNPDFHMVTASTMKSITTGVALQTLGPDYRYKTSVAYSGTISAAGVLEGNLYIVGGGDPTLGSTNKIATPINTVFGKWTAAVKAAGINRIDGYIVADDRCFDPVVSQGNWGWKHTGDISFLGASGLSFYENKQQFLITPGNEAGEPAHIEQFYPIVPNLTCDNRVTTAPAAKKASSVSYYPSEFYTISTFEGNVPLGAPPTKFSRANKHPALSCGWHFKEYLVKNQVACRDSIVYARDFPAPPAMDLFVLETTESVALSEIIKVTNKVSHNMFAETIAKTYAREIRGEGNYLNAQRTTFSTLRNIMKLDMSGFSMNDGSGLSRLNMVSPRFFTQYFAAMQKSPHFKLFLESLPVPGGEGTLRNVLKDEPNELKQRIHAKSGTLSNVKSYAGYVESEAGMIRFAILMNNFTSPVTDIQPYLEDFMKELALYKGGKVKKVKKKK